MDEATDIIERVKVYLSLKQLAVGLTETEKQLLQECSTYLEGVSGGKISYSAEPPPRQEGCRSARP